MTKLTREKISEILIHQTRTNENDYSSYIDHITMIEQQNHIAANSKLNEDDL